MQLNKVSDSAPGHLLDFSSLSTWKDHGFILDSDLIPEEFRNSIDDWVNEIAALPEGEGPWEHYWEESESGPLLCRTEQFLEGNEGIHALTVDGPIQEAASKLLGEQALIYKEKINYKLPGGAGFAPHQDAPAYPLINKHVTCLIAVDDMTVENGCLEFALDHPLDLLEQDAAGCIPEKIVKDLHWRTCEVPRNSCFFFSSHAPHRSAANHSKKSRRAIYLTYNGVSDGDARSQYYAQRQAYLSGEGDDKINAISMISDFQGKIVDR
jgi:hypothetical protein